MLPEVKRERKKAEKEKITFFRNVQNRENRHRKSRIYECQKNVMRSISSISIRVPAFGAQK